MLKIYLKLCFYVRISAEQVNRYFIPRSQSYLLLLLLGCRAAHERDMCLEMLPEAFPSGLCTEPGTRVLVCCKGCEHYAFPVKLCLGVVSCLPGRKSSLPSGGMSIVFTVLRYCSFGLAGFPHSCPCSPRHASC